MNNKFKYYSLIILKYDVVYGDADNIVDDNDLDDDDDYDDDNDHDDDDDDETIPPLEQPSSCSSWDPVSCQIEGSSWLVGVLSWEGQSPASSLMICILICPHLSSWERVSEW